MDDMEGMLAENTRATMDSTAKVERVHEIVVMGESVFRAFEATARFAARMWVWLGPIVRAFTVIAAAATAAKAAWVALRGGTPPQPPTH